MLSTFYSLHFCVVCNVCEKSACQGTCLSIPSAVGQCWDRPQCLTIFSAPPWWHGRGLRCVCALLPSPPLAPWWRWPGTGQQRFWLHVERHSGTLPSSVAAGKQGFGRLFWDLASPEAFTFGSSHSYGQLCTCSK